MTIKSFIAAVAAFVCLAGNVSAKEEGPLKCPMNRDYWLYTPDTIDEAKSYWLVVGVHGHRGKGSGAAGLAKWVDEFDNVIVVGPTFPSTGPYYQQLGGGTDKQLQKLHKELSKKYKLHKKVFLYGFSGGSQFTQRFTMKYPKDVIGCSAHSGGTWGKASKKAVMVPFAVSCGEKDTKVSTGAPAPRIDLYKNFFSQMHKGKFFYKAAIRPNEGHSAGKWCKEVTKELFELSTTGLYPSQREAVDKEIERIETLIKDGKKDAAKAAIRKLPSFRIPKLKYEDKDSEHPNVKKPHAVNEYGWTSNKKADKEMILRAKAFLKEKGDELLAKVDPAAAAKARKRAGRR